ncbi:DNA-processing protein DprA [Propioniciclava soli]|uniref:DNA-processing protein DprA n=1 Tax=Propioniciclava soli TaxID=2775081 RepID=A0ABZ3CDN7_9ACTN
MPDEVDERGARMRLACVVEPGDPAIGPLLREFGAPAVWEQLLRPGPDGAWRRRAAALDLRGVRVLMHRHGLRFIVPGDDEWPEQLAPLEYCEPVQGSRGVPLGLWVCGQGSLAELTRSSVALVGSRASTAYGERLACDLAADLAAGRPHGTPLTVVSGAAFGIDAAAHRGALAEDGPTVAVLAGGLDTPYPKAHEALLGRIAHTGVVVSENAPGETPSRRRFLSRNRIIAALSLGTVIVEAALRSGARNTVTWASACGRPVMAVPGPVGSATSATPHRLIRGGEAVLVERVEDIREQVGRFGELAPGRPPQDRLFDHLDAPERAVYEALPSRGGRDAGDVALRSGLALPACLAVLAHLAEQDLAERSDQGGWRIGRVQDRPVRLSAAATAPPTVPTR